MENWIKVDELRPKERETVIVEHQKGVNVAMYKNGKFINRSSREEFKTVEWWLPLPSRATKTDDKYLSILKTVVSQTVETNGETYYSPVGSINFVGSVEDVNKRIDEVTTVLLKRNVDVFIEYVSKGKTYDEIGRELGLTRERIRQIYERVLRELKFNHRYICEGEKEGEPHNNEVNDYIDVQKAKTIPISEFDITAGARHHLYKNGITTAYLLLIKYQRILKYLPHRYEEEIMSVVEKLYTEICIK